MMTLEHVLGLVVFAPLVGAFFLPLAGCASEKLCDSLAFDGEPSREAAAKARRAATALIGAARAMGARA